MACGGINNGRHPRPRKLGVIPSVSRRLSLGVGNEQTDAGRDGRTRLERPKFSGANGDREMHIFPVQLTTSRIGNLTRLIYTLSYVMPTNSIMVMPFRPKVKAPSTLSATQHEKGRHFMR